MIVKGTKQLGNFKKGINLYIPKKRTSASPAPITTSRAFNSSGVQVGLTITGNIPDDWVRNETTVASVTFANNNSVTSIGAYAVSNTGITSITIPNSVTSIGSYAFATTGLTSITIPNNVLTIGVGMFQSCASLASATIGTGLTSIGAYMFRYVSSLASITIPNSVTIIGSYAFYNTSLASATIGTGVTSIASYAFANTSLTSVTIPNSVTSIGSRAFNNCTSLASATIGTGVTSIGSYAFTNCTSLATVLCYVAQSAFTGSSAFYNTASPLVIQARITDASWTADTGLTFQGNTNVTVIKNL